MKTKHLKLVLLIALLTGACNVRAQNSMTIQQSNGNSPTILLNEIEKITFSNNNLVIDNKDGNDVIYALASIKNITFEATKTDIDEEITLTSIFSVYPNPADNVIYLNTPNNTSIRIYRMDGIAVMSLNSVNANEAINISNLPKGIYFVKSNHYTTKFYKL